MVMCYSLLNPFAQIDRQTDTSTEQHTTDFGVEFTGEIRRAVSNKEQGGGWEVIGVIN